MEFNKKTAIDQMNLHLIPLDDNDEIHLLVSEIVAQRQDLPMGVFA